MTMNPDVFRDLLLVLDRLQRSPPEAILLSPADLGQTVRSEEQDVRDALRTLSDLALIDGPGPYGDGWLFRQVTPRGQFVLEEAGDPARWEALKRHYLGARSP